MNAQLLTQTRQSRRGCDLCGATEARELYTAADWLRNSEEAFIVAECCGCGVLRTLPEMTEGELARFYPGGYWGATWDPTENWMRSSQSEKTSFLAGCKLTGGRILDVGCGSGFFLRMLDAGGWSRFGVEIDKEAAAAAGRALGSGSVFNGTLMEAECADDYFDTVTFWSSLEHSNKPRADLTEARRILKRGGTVIVQVPNAASYQARIFRGGWYALDAPRHRYHFTPETLCRLLAETGFEIYRTTFFSKSHNSHALRQSLKARLVGENRFGAGTALFLLCIPFIKPLDWLMSLQKQGATITVAARAV
jgi:SAM-dependent methyltransferase